jgi:6-pyruvoyltetrahydropterin/6-carboxytetrahydropterin synthase
MKIYKNFKFCASHQLRYPSFSDEENRQRFGKCVQLHGHNYLLRVCVEGELDVSKGYFLNFKNLTEVVQQHVIHALDHQHLNDVPLLKGHVPTVENTCQSIVDVLDPLLNHEDYHLYSCTLHETDTSSAKIYVVKKNIGYMQRDESTQSI